jgi:hypothetical protein
VVALFTGGLVCLLTHARKCTTSRSVIDLLHGRLLTEIDLVNQVTTWVDEGRIATTGISVFPDGLGKRQMYSYGHHPTLNATVSQTSSFGSMVSATASVSHIVSTTSDGPIVTSTPAPASVTHQIHTTIVTSEMTVTRSTHTETETDMVSGGTAESTHETEITVVNTATVVPVPASASVDTTGRPTATTLAVTGGSSAWSLDASGWNLTTTSSYGPTAGTLNITSATTVQPSSTSQTESVGFSTSR